MGLVQELITRVQTWLSIREPGAAGQSLETLQAAFRRQYANFRALLTANNNALELMAEMEETMAGGRPFGMTFVRGHSTAVSVNVFKMVQHLLELGGGERYQALVPVCRAITARIEAICERTPPAASGPPVLPMTAIGREHADQVGEKMANLGEVGNRVGLPVPPGFAITAAAAQRFLAANQLQEEINRRLQTLDVDDLEALYQTSAAIQKLIAAAPLPPDLEAAILAAYHQLESQTRPEVLVSLRSSAIGEDTGFASFAGQYRTQLHVAPEFLLQTYKEIVAGKYRSQAIIYRLQRGFRHQDVTMCVGCLAMVEARASGVTYSRSPRDPRSSWLVVSAVTGLAKQVVDGVADAEVYRVDRQPPHPVLRQEHGHATSSRPPDGLPLPGPLIADEIRQLARVAIRLEEHFGSPQDIEWSIDTAGQIILLQSRPLGLFTAPSEDEAPAREEAEAPGPDCLAAGGITASAGAACGPVRVVRSNVDLLQFPAGAVLVVQHPLPEWATLLPRAKAVVSETGQVAAHLATVARELGIPALFRLPAATRLLEDGQEVTVDATGRRVYA
ncbi:MAG: PEP/pyruvate-binding domain-containing protein, partial [Thermodesulfobacteriota bacterium]